MRWIETVQAQTTLLPGDFKPEEANFQSVVKIVNYWAGLGFRFVLVVAAIFLVYAGFRYITSLGNPGQVEQAKQTLLFTIVGIAVVAGAYLAIEFAQRFISQ